MLRAVVISQIMVHSSVRGLYLSTVLTVVCPLYPPTAYSKPSRTPTPALLLCSIMLVVAVHVSELGSYCSTYKKGKPLSKLNWFTVSVACSAECFGGYFAKCAEWGWVREGGWGWSQRGWGRRKIYLFLYLGICFPHPNPALFTEVKMETYM